MNLKTLGDFKKEGTPHLNTDKSDDKKKNTSSYTGGESSGMAVINPDVAGIMSKAEKNSTYHYTLHSTPEEFAKK